MLPSKGYFSNFNCPFYECGTCDRPHCHFKHSKKDKDVNLTDSETNEVNYEKNETLIKQLVKETVKQVLNHQEIKDPNNDNLLDTSLIVDNVVSTLRNPKNAKDIIKSETINDTSTSKLSYKPTPISELTKRHIPVQYAPTRPNHLLSRKVPTNSLTYTPTVKNNDTVLNNSSVYEPSHVTGTAQVSSATYAPTKLTETNKIDNSNSSDDYKPTNLYDSSERSSSPLTYIPTQINKEPTIEWPAEDTVEQQKIKLPKSIEKTVTVKKPPKSLKSTEVQKESGDKDHKKSKTEHKVDINHKKKEKRKTDSEDNHKIVKDKQNRHQHDHIKSDKHKYVKHKHSKSDKSHRKKSYDHRDKKEKSDKVEQLRKSKLNSTDEEIVEGSSSDVELVPDKETCIIINDSSSNSSSDQVSELNCSEIEDGRTSPIPKKRKLSISGGSLPLLQNPNPVSPPPTLCERWRKARQQVQKSNLTGKLRISSVPNVTSLLNAKDRLLSMAQKPAMPNKPRAEEEVKPQVKPRVAHKPATLDYPKCELDPEIKLPSSVRQVCLNTMYETFAQFCPPAEAKKKAVATELHVAKRVHLTKTYQNSMAVAVLRIRKNKGEIKELENKKNEHELEIGISAQSVPDFTYGLSLYECFQQYIINDKEYCENGFPLPHPTRKGCAYIEKTARRASLKQPDDPNQRICTNCSKQYFVDDNGFPVSENDCHYHWGRLYKYRAASTIQEKYRCCNAEVGSEPCVNARYHVSSIINEDCLEDFLTTTTVSAEPQVYALDCEMCFTKIGMELARCTLLSLDGNIVLDTTVLPSSPILDYCTRFSGITESMIKQCRTTFSEFRQQLLKIVHKNTIIIGHSLENDFKAMKIIHKAVVDTSVIFPHKLGLPYKMALRNLVKDKLNLSIQDKESGHDSKEDAEACLKLMIRKIREDAKKRKPRILQHNAEAELGGHSYRLAPNHLADINGRHYHKSLILLKPSRRHFKDTSFDEFSHGDPDGLPQRFDWRDLGLITESLDQKDCGSCYAFSVAGAVQGQFFRKNGTLEYLSPQQLVDCSVLVGNYGCNGGSLRKTVRYVESNGLMLESDYPYKGRQSICRYNFLKHTIKIKSWIVLPPRDEHALKVAVVRKGPVVVAVNASPHTFQLYHSGVYDDHNCPDDVLNHAMLLIGYTEDAWILKNWWTDRWGHGGYMYLRRNVNRCGIADYAMIVQI